MWIKTFSKEYQHVTKEAIWNAWADPVHWPQWDTELEYCAVTDSFDKGNQFILKPKGGIEVRLFLSEVLPYFKFTDYCKFLGAVMYDAHEIEDIPGGVRITNTITMKGPLTFLWVTLVAKKLAQGVEKQTDNLVEYARKAIDEYII